ncbi:MAG: protein-export protein SecB [Candidatus Pelagibacter sp. TMED253]|nr:MAG: protein-export protein SecB [Candidatus Pelagibacter sp. TMED253]|tara:strand:+ start:434 stop:853 length:420 start_codon:yes stop_codon:yes gene_type:complete
MSYKIVGKYIKNLDFKIPNPKTFSLLSKNISNYKINVDIKSNQLKDRIVEVEITLNLTPVKDDFDKINTKIIYSTIIELKDGITDKKEIEKIILINVPSEVYPELRKIFVFVFENSGFKDIKISNNVDFQKLYNLKKTQ